MPLLRFGSKKSYWTSADRVSSPSRRTSRLSPSATGSSTSGRSLFISAFVSAHSYLGQCHSHLLAGRVRLIVIGGLPGTGKTTLADALHEEVGWPVLQSDVIRKELAGLDPLHPAPSSFGTGLYTPAMIDQTYEEMCARAQQPLGMGETVILDASFSIESRRCARHTTLNMASATDGTSTAAAFVSMAVILCAIAVLRFERTTTTNGRPGFDRRHLGSPRRHRCARHVRMEDEHGRSGAMHQG
jgi:predicted kinase